MKASIPQQIEVMGKRMILAHPTHEVGPQTGPVSFDPGDVPEFDGSVNAMTSERLVNLVVSTRKPDEDCQRNSKTEPGLPRREVLERQRTDHSPNEKDS